ncbi:MAG: HipA domain-containing protein [Leptospirillia bacterium]
MRILHVWRDRKLVGMLTAEDKTPNNGTKFRYDEGWLSDPSSEPLSPVLPLKNFEYDDDICKTFFANLLPESNARIVLERAFRVSGTFDFLKLFGSELSGGYSVLDPGEEDEEGSLIPVNSGELKKLLESGSVGVIRLFKKYRLSLAGGQEKIAVVFNGKDFFIPTGREPSTHILKPNIFGDPNLERTALNEAFVMRLLYHLGLPVAETKYDPDLNVVIVKRFDRLISDRRVIRLPQLDLCQAMGKYAEQKYEEQGGIGIREMGPFFRKYAEDPLNCATVVATGILAAALVGDMDHHAKNISFFYEKGFLSPTPLYDVSNSMIYRGLQNTLAFSIGGISRVEKLDRISIQTFGKEIGIGRDAGVTIAKNLAERMNAAIDKTLQDDEFSDLSIAQKSFVSNRIVSDIRNRVLAWTKALSGSRLIARP